MSTTFFLLLIITFTLVSFIPTSDATGTCGISLNNTTFDFGVIAKDSLSGNNDVPIQFTNSGNVTADVTVSGNNWLSGNIEHIASELTKFSTTDQGTSGLDVSYASKNALNSTSGAIPFGVIPIGPSFNNTYWQLQATMQNLPFSGAITRAITFTGSCLG